MSDFQITGNRNYYFRHLRMNDLLQLQTVLHLWPQGGGTMLMPLNALHATMEATARAPCCDKTF